MTILFAQPYDLAASGFYFTSADAYAAKADALRNDYGQPVEEFEIQFIDGETIDAQLFGALAVSQCTIAPFLEAVEDWDYDDKVRIIIAVGEVGVRFALGKDAPNEVEVDLYPIDSLSDLAVRFVEDGLFGEMRERRVGGRFAADVFVHPDTDDLGLDIARQARLDPLFRDTIVFLTCVHELGHAFGLPHTRDFADIMYSFQFGGDFVAYFMRFRAKVDDFEGMRDASPFSAGDRGSFEVATAAR